MIAITIETRDEMESEMGERGLQQRRGKDEMESEMESEIESEMEMRRRRDEISRDGIHHFWVIVSHQNGHLVVNRS